MRLTLEKMVISNFKGIRDLEIDFGHVTKISGANGTGKSSIADAFAWVLFNKDSQGNAPGTADFQEKPRDEDGNEIHNLDTTVELYCRLDTMPFNLRRTQRENWVKKRGSTDSVFQGNVSTYWINEVETKLTDFRSRISEIVSEEAFRLIGSLSAFNALDWKKRREHLLTMTDIDADSYLLQQDSYRQLADEVAQRGVGVEDLRKILTDQRKRTNNELQLFPVRIDEANKALPTFEAGEVEAAEKGLKSTEAELSAIQEKIAQAKAQSKQANNSELIFNLEAEVVGLRRIVSSEHRANIQALERNRNDASEAYRRATDALTDTEHRLTIAEVELKQATNKRDDLRKSYSEAYERTMDVKSAVGTVCPTCERPFPEEQVQAAIEKTRQMFEERRKEDLLKIKEQGIKTAEEIARLEKVADTLRADAKQLGAKIEAASAERDAAYEKLNNAPKEPDYSKNPEIDALLARIKTLKAESDASPDEKITEYENEKEQVTTQIKKYRVVLALRDSGEETKKRIVELEKQQHNAASRIGEIEQLIALVEQFVQDRCRVLEDSINDKFPTVRWKLFETQINGGIADVCQAYIPCPSGLVAYGSANTAAKINADIEIVNVLSAHHGVSLPLFADNAERVNRLADTDTQLISLQVTTDGELTVEIEQEIKHKEAV